MREPPTWEEIRANHYATIAREEWRRRQCWFPILRFLNHLARIPTPILVLAIVAGLIGAVVCAVVQGSLA